MQTEPLGSLVGWVGAIVGSSVGVLGGIIGTYLAIKNTKGPRERAYVVKASITCCFLVLTYVAGMLLISTWHRTLLTIPYVILLVVEIRTWNKTQLRIRNEESDNAAYQAAAADGPQTTHR